MNFSPDKMETLLKMAGQKLGKSPNELKQQLESGNLGSALGNLDKNKQEQINSLMQDPKKLETMLQNDMVKKMLGGLMGGKK